MEIKSFFTTAIVAMGLATGTAQASPTWTWNIQGTISSGKDGLGLFGTVGQDLKGKSFTKTIIADVDPSHYPSVSSNANTSDMHGYTSAGFTVSFTIGDVTVVENIVSSKDKPTTYADQYLLNYVSSNLQGNDQVYTYNVGIDTVGNSVRVSDYAYSDRYDWGGRGNPFISTLDFSQYLTASKQTVAYLWSESYITNASGSTSFFSNPDSITVNAGAAVPEPASIALLGLGFAGIGMMRRRTAK